MAKRRNEDTIRAIRKAAREIIQERGYEATTYSELAKRTGIARTTVQHYVPRKEALATELMQEIADRSLARARSMVPEGEHPLALLYLAGQISHGIYYSTPGLGRLLRDVAADRRLQRSIAPHYETAELSVLGLDEASLDRGALDELIYVMGGIYEVHFACLSEGRMPESSWLVRTDIDLLAKIAGIGDAERDDLLDRYAMSRDELLAIGAEVAAQMMEEE